MAANKFATMVSKNTNKITLILIYAVLEWTLILLLLLNSLFSYLIVKFSDYFGLKPPCLWCSRVDHILEPTKNSNNFHRDLLCEFHSEEVSKLGFCSNHQKLAESKDMCEGCLSSIPDFDEVSSKNLALFEVLKEVGMIRNDADKVFDNSLEVNLKCCSCCGVNLDSHVYSSYILIKPSWDVLEYPQKNNLISEIGQNDDPLEDVGSDQCENEQDSLIKSEEDQILPEKDDETEKVEKVLEEEEEEEREFKVEENPKRAVKDQSVQVSIGEDAFSEILPQHLEFFLDLTGNCLVPVELVDSATEDNQSRYGINEEEQKNVDNHQETSLASDGPVEGGEEIAAEKTCREWEPEPAFFYHKAEEEEPRYAVLEPMEMAERRTCRESEPGFYHKVEEEEPRYEVLEPMEMEEDENSWVFHSHSKDTDDFETMGAADHEEENSDFTPALEDANQVNANETDADVSIGTEIPDLDATDDFQTEDIIFSYESNLEDPSTSSNGFHLHGAEEDGQQKIELRGLSLELNEDMVMNQLSFFQELDGTEEDKIPDTPTSVDSLNSLHKKLLLIEKKDSGTEDSLDGSMRSEMEGGDGVAAVESLKSALRNERKTLQALYAELEEERSASAVAANQTMAMITRLQEEKSQMQMEALQYQRMMEEQSEYDQEALQLLNELMVKREKEKHELEKELEIYRRRVLEHETKEKIRILRSKDGSARSGFSSASCSNAEDSDGISIDLNQEAKEEGFYSHRECSNNNTPVDSVLNLEESLADFEEERISIFEQLKALEEKLMTLDDDDDEDDEEEQHFEDVSPEPHFHEENGNRVKENGHVNGYSKEYHQERRIIGSKGKSLLPLFDATTDDDENGDMILNANGNGNGNGNGFDSNGMHHNLDVKDLETENKKLDIEEEVDHLYERLQALEADREFLKHCISSLKKGDKGMDLLQEILQHLRDLRNVELRAKNFSDATTI